MKLFKSVLKAILDNEKENPTAKNSQV
jgi:hypothetical protein